MSNAESSMVALVEEYLAMRRELGFKLRVQGWLLMDFARFADSAEAGGLLTVDLATRWATRSAGSPASIAQRLTVVRQFARYRTAFDSRTQVPPAGLLGSATVRRKPPHVYSEVQIAELLGAAGALRPRGGLRPHTYVTLFSLLVSTGLRVSEARHLAKQDVDLNEGFLVVRETKFRKTRLVPLHPSTAAALRRYAAIRDGYCDVPRSDFFFITDHAAALPVRTVFFGEWSSVRGSWFSSR